MSDAIRDRHDIGVDGESKLQTESCTGATLPVCAHHILCWNLSSITQSTVCPFLMRRGADFFSANSSSGSGSSSGKSSPEYIHRKISKLFDDNYLPKHNKIKSHAMKNEKNFKAVVYRNLDDIISTVEIKF